MSHLLPVSAGAFVAARQRVSVPLFGPALPVAGMPDAAVDCSALYAGETVRAINDIIPAREAVQRLTRSQPAGPAS
jgi:hypothetical protein